MGYAKGYMINSRFSLKKILVASSLVVFATQALASFENKSEQFFQPDFAESSADLGLRLTTFKYDVKSGGTKVSGLDSSTTLVGGEYLYGLTDELALGGGLDYSTNKTTAASDSKAAGLGDLRLLVRGLRVMDQMVLRYGGTLGFSLGKRLDATTSKDGNIMSGGMSLNPYVAFEYLLPDFHIGLALDYALPFERTSDNQAATSVESKTTGGNLLTVKPYFDWHYGTGILAGYLAFGSKSEETKKTGATESKTAAYSSVGLGIKASYDVTPAAAGVFGLDVTSYNDVPTGVDKAGFNVTTLTLGGRMLF